MTLKLPQSLSFLRSDHRAEFERARTAFKSALQSEAVEETTASLLALGGALEGGVARLKRDLLGSSLCWNEDHHALIGWLHQQHRRLADNAYRVLEGLPEMPLKLAAFVLHHEGEAMKWIAGRERPDLAAINAFMSRAMDLGLARTFLQWAADGRGFETTLESLYVRLLLLDRLGTGVLTSQQVEVLDAWLREWRGELQLFDAGREGPCLHVDLASAQGLRGEAPQEGGRLLWLALAPLERRRQEVVREMQRGRIVPAYGCAAEFRIEEHVAVLRHLQRAFAAPADASARREQRASAPGSRIEAWLGIHEILSHGNAAPGVETGQWRTLGSTETVAIDPHRRYLWMCDTSAGGCGFEALEQDATGLEIGDLLGWRQGGAIVLARIIRRLPGKTHGQVFLGVRLLTHAGLPFVLKRVDAPEGGSDAEFLYVPGDDASGRRDAFLVPETVFSHDRTYRARVGDEAFVLRLNRVRDRGRGWILAGFEIVPQRAAAPMPPASRDAAVLAVDEATIATGPEHDDVDPWSHEVPLRLLD